MIAAERKTLLGPSGGAGFGFTVPAESSIDDPCPQRRPSLRTTRNLPRSEPPTMTSPCAAAPRRRQNRI